MIDRTYSMTSALSMFGKPCMTMSASCSKASRGLSE